MLWRIGSSLSRARTLQCVHFSGNQGLTASAKMQLLDRIRCKPMVPERNFGLQVGADLYDLGERKQERDRKPDPERLFQDDRQALMIKKRGLAGMMTSEQAQFKANQILTFERQLGYGKGNKETNKGYKGMMPGAGQWRQLLEPKRE